MKNRYIQNIMRNARAWILVLFASFAALGVSAQTTTITTQPVAPFIAGEEDDVFEFDNDDGVTAYPAGTSFILYYEDGIDFTGGLDVVNDQDNILGTTTTQGDAVGIDFNWPDFNGNVNLFLGAFSGSSVEGVSTDVFDADLDIVAGADPGDGLDGPGDIDFYRAGNRYLITNEFSIDFDQTVFLSVDMDLSNVIEIGAVEDNHVRVQYSIDGGATFNNLDIAAETTFHNGNIQPYDFDLSSLSGTQDVSFRILQDNSIGAGIESWSVDAISFSVGDPYSPVAIGAGPFALANPFNVVTPTITVVDIEDDTPASIVFATPAYPGDEITVFATFPDVDLSQYSYVVVLEDDTNGDEYLLDGLVVNQTTSPIEATGDIPTGISYENMNVSLLAYVGASPLLGLNETFTFNGGVADANDFVVEGGAEDGSGILFEDAGDRWTTSPEFNITTSTNSSLTFTLARENDLISPTGTDLILEFTSDGTTYTELDAIALNSIVFGGAGTDIVIDGADWPAGVVSGSTQFRVRQEGNNGVDLDAWRYKGIEIVSGSNIIMDNISYGATFSLNIDAPVVTIDALDIPDLAYPMTDLTLTYSIDEGAFPAGTEVTLLLDRSTDPEFDIVLGTLTDIAAGAGAANGIDFQVPPLEADDYTLYLYANGENFFNASLPIYDLDIEVTNISFSDPVIIVEEEYGYPGSSITVDYIMGGTPGAGAELMLSVYDDTDDIEDFVMIGATTTFDGTITATLPVDVDYDPAQIRLSVGTGIFSNNIFDELVVNESWLGGGASNRFPDNVVESYEGVSDAFGESDVFTSTNVRSATTVPFNMEYGGNVQFNLYTPIYTSSFDVMVQVSSDGTTWTDWDEINVTFNGFHTFNETLPNQLWAEETQFRLIYNEDGAFDFEEHPAEFYYARIETPSVTQGSQVTENFNLIQPSLDVSTYDETAFRIGETVTIDYNAQGFPASTEYAAVIEQNDAYYVLGTSAGQDASSISATMPLIVPIDPDETLNPNDFDLIIVPFEPATAGGDYVQGVTTVLDDEDDFTSNEGTDDSEPNFYFYHAGERFAVTREMTELDGASYARLNFFFSGTFGLTSNKLTVPRLQASTDGATYAEIPVYELADGETQIYDDGLLYSDIADYPNFSAMVPAAYLTATTQFRWIQPLNTGQFDNTWSINNVSIEVGESNALADFVYTTTANNDPSTGITIDAPSLDNYVWQQTDLNDPVFNGETFEYTWGIAEDTDADPFPAGTVFTFTIDEEDIETGEDIVLGTSNVLGTNLVATVPSYLENGNYDVMLTATLEVDGEEYVIYEDEVVGDFDLFLQVIKTVFIGEDDSKLFAGDDASFSVEVVNSETTNSTVYDNLFYNLILENAYNGEDYLLASQQGLAGTFDVTIPPFTDAGNRTFVVKATEGEAIGVDGTFFNLDKIEDLFDDTDETFFNFDDKVYHIGGDVYRMESPSGFRELVTKDLDVSTVQNVEFILDFNQEIDDLTTDQMLEFEYSIDGGVNYISIETFPRAEDEGGVITNERMFLPLPVDAQTASTRFRWRQEDTKGTIDFEDVFFGYVPEFPFETEEHNHDVIRQLIQVEGFDALTVCSDGVVNINYSILGSFGEEAYARIYYRDQNDESDDELTGYDYLLPAGATGSIEFALPSAFFDDYGFFNKEMEFALRVQDMSFTETAGVYDDYFSQFNSTTGYGATTVEYISPIDLDASPEFSSSQTLCSAEDVIVDINNIQDYFVYQLFNVEADTLIGDALTYDPEVGIDYINLGSLEDVIEVGLMVTSASSDGTLSCNTVTVVETDELVINPDYVLYRSRDYGSNYIVSVDGTTEAQCEGDSKIRLRAGRIPSNSGGVSYASTANVEWFRDNLATPIGNIQTLTNFEVSGGYFARVTDGVCSYLTDTLTVNISVAPDRPVVTVVSGDLIACEDVIEVELAGPDGFAFYLWNTGESTQNITVEDGGSYTVQVSDVSFDIGCGSPSSVPVIVEDISNPIFEVLNTTFYDEDNIINTGSALADCDGVTVYFFENGGFANNGTVVITRDGVEYASTTNTSFFITESGVYSAERFSSEIEISCSNSIGDFTVTIDEAPEEVPALTATGALEFCAGEGEVLLTAPAGFTNYQWYRNGGSISSNSVGFSATDNTLTATDAGTYSVRVGTSPSCLSPVSNIIVLQVRALPNPVTSFSQRASVCGEGAVDIVLNNNVQRYLTYQLIDRSTGLPSGDPVDGSTNGNTVLTSDPIAESTQFYVEVSYADGSGCTNSRETSFITVSPNNVVLELNGNTLQAIISSYSNTLQETKWFRNGVELVNKAGSTSISVIDAAEYQVQVEWASGCMITSNSIDLAGPAAPAAVTGIVASTFPNPISEVLNVSIDGENFGTYNVTVMTVTGQVMLSEDFNKDVTNFTSQLSIGELQTGLYNLRVSNGDEYKNIRIFKK